MDYRKICQNYLKGLNPRTLKIIERRFGLRKGKRETLEVIGQTLGLTRERVRQIEAEGLEEIKPKIKKDEKIFQRFNNAFISFGGVKKEDDLLNFLGEGKYQNQIFFLLVNGGSFKRVLEDDKFYTFWTAGKEFEKKAKETVKLVINNFKKEKTPFSLLDLAKKQNQEKKITASYIGISKEIQKNLEGKYGLKNWLEINPKGIKDKAYLVLKRQEKPLHFRDIASLIEKLPFENRKAVHTATVHNELIKDDRFVLVGRGLYALADWGYMPGVVKDVIKNILKESKRSLTKGQIFEKVQEQRFVKENTIFLNLQDKNLFARDEKGRYNIKEA